MILGGLLNSSTHGIIACGVLWGMVWEMDNNSLIMKELQFLLYGDAGSGGSIEVLVKDGTLWATQRAIADLFNVGIPSVSKHLSNIFRDGELNERDVMMQVDSVSAHGALKEKNQTHQIWLYNLDAIISVGYRINSTKATRFRQWATGVLNEYIRKGFVLDDDRLKQGNTAFGEDYFRELLERVRSIRASERRIWQQITDIFAECSVDYDKESPTTREFYAMVQNRFHYAITGKTASEIIYDAADHTCEHMGLKTWKHAPDGRILKSDVTVAKNYLSEQQIRRLERTVTGFFDYIEDLIERRNSFTMSQFAESINAFLTFRQYEILPGKGRVSKKEADAKAEKEYQIFNRTQQIDSDFDKVIRLTLALPEVEGESGTR